ncbi:hypothetical protein MKW92_017396 [Papaver armeniacum]|nr:hypothetical protein MKW92_017396 [Papaver armeniacum]
MKYTERRHHSHPSCELHMKNHQTTPYTCDGCNQTGLGLSFSCEKCNYDLHQDCFSASSSMCHQFYKNSNFKFYDVPVDKLERFCDACGGDIKGFSYHCDQSGDSGLDLHPCCSKLPIQIEAEGVKLYLQKKLTSNCSWCGKKVLEKKFTGWSYVSTCGDFQFHVNCVMESLVKNCERSHFNCVNSPRIEFGGSSTLERTIVGNTERRMVTRTRMQDGFKKFWRIAKLVMGMIVSAILGDPTSATVLLIESLVSSS